MKELHIEFMNEQIQMFEEEHNRMPTDAEELILAERWGDWYSDYACDIRACFGRAV